MRTLTSLLLAATMLLAGCTYQAFDPPATATPTTSPTASESASPTPTPSEPAVIGLSYIPNVQFAPFYLAEADGAFAATGTPATLRHHGAQEGLFTALLAGQEDFVLAGGDELLQARDQTGADLVAVATYYRRFPVQVIVKQDGPIKTLADLRGKTIGIPGRYGSSWFGLLVALRTAGLTEADVDIQEIGYTQQAALTTDKVDAVVGFSNNDLVQFNLAGVPAIGLPISTSTPPLVGASLVTTRAYLDSNPDLVKAVAQGMVAGIQATIDDARGNNPGDRALEVTKAQVPGLSGDALEAARATLKATVLIMMDAQGKADGSLDVAGWQAMGDFMLETGLIAKPADIAAATAPEVLG